MHIEVESKRASEVQVALCNVVLEVSNSEGIVRSLAADFGGSVERLRQLL